MAKKDEKKSAVVGRVVNKKAFHDYELIEKVEAGIALVGSEVKSLRSGKADLAGSFANLQNKECYLIGCNIATYPQAGANNHEPLRKRKLLLHKQQIIKITTKLTQKGFTLVPLRIYFNDRGLAKVELALARGKRQYDKRKKIEHRQSQKDIAKSLKRYK